MLERRLSQWIEPPLHRSRCTRAFYASLLILVAVVGSMRGATATLADSANVTPGVYGTDVVSGGAWSPAEAGDGVLLKVSSPMFFGLEALGEYTSVHNLVPPLRTDPASVDVSIKKAVLVESLGPDEPITFTLTLANIGTAPATGVVVTDIIPTEVVSTNVDSTLLITQTGTEDYIWRVQTLTGTAEGTITVTGRITSAFGVEQSFNNVAVIDDPQDQTPVNNTSSVLIGGPRIFLPLVLNQWSLRSLTLFPTDDAPVMRGRPDLSLGYDVQRLMGVGYQVTKCSTDDPPDPYEISRALVRFDLSSVPVDAVHRALFHFQEAAYCGYDSAADPTLTVYRLLDPWAEETVNWSTAPAFGEAHKAVVVDWDVVKTWYRVDVTALVNAWLAGTPNHGLMLRGYEADGDSDPNAVIIGIPQTGSYVDGEPAGPYLEISYSAPPP